MKREHFYTEKLILKMQPHPHTGFIQLKTSAWRTSIHPHSCEWDALQGSQNYEFVNNSIIKNEFFIS